MQMAAWQRNAHPPDYLHAMRPSQRMVLETPESLHSLLPSGVECSRVKPVSLAGLDSNKHIASPPRSELADLDIFVHAT